MTFSGRTSLGGLFYDSRDGNGKRREKKEKFMANETTARELSRPLQSDAATASCYLEPVRVLPRGSNLFVGPVIVISSLARALDASWHSHDRLRLMRQLFVAEIESCSYARKRL